MALSETPVIVGMPQQKIQRGSVTLGRSIVNDGTGRSLILHSMPKLFPIVINVTVVISK